MGSFVHELIFCLPACLVASLFVGQASWGAAVLHWFAACAFRRARDGDRAEAALVQGSLRLRPRYTRALQELALVRLDRGDYSGAIRTLEELLRLDALVLR